ncbi:prostate and testis expressed protein 1 isoform X3 [Canis lupus familiaris]|uniref:prostate and testis expressed protein 1 isoform X3 n=1 Tax=Canis lupus familiaris TaxID=9615 RepID=UPI0018F35BD2|nr:prostate and testis expressed protein 1 isoform X3 [Canis lupus familiaris]
MGSSFLLSSHIQGLPCSRMIDNVTLVPPESPVILSGSLENSKRLIHELFINEEYYPKIIQCRMCHLQFPGEKCSRGRGFCIATENEVCMTGRIFKRGFPELEMTVRREGGGTGNFEQHYTRIRSNRNCGNTPNYQEVHKTPFVLPSVRKSEHSGILPYKNASVQILQVHVHKSCHS